MTRVAAPEAWQDCEISVGAVFTFFEGGRKVPVLPIVEATFKDGERTTPVPRHLKIAWRDSERETNEGRRRYIWVYDPRDPEHEQYAYLTLKVDPKFRDLFEQLRARWGFWILRVRQNRTTHDYQVPCAHEGRVYTAAGGIDAIINTFDGTDRDQYVRRGHRALMNGWDKRTGMERAEAPPILYPEVHRTRAAFSEAVKAALQRRVDAAEQIAGPLPWRVDWTRLDEENRRLTHEVILQQYMLAMKQAYLSANGDAKDVTYVGRSQQEMTSEEGRTASTIIWAALRNARIFELTADAYVSLMTAADRYTIEKIVGIRHRSGSERYTPEEAKAIGERTDEAGRLVPFPENLPFESCYLAWGGGVTVSGDTLRFYGTPEDTIRKVPEGRLIATLVEANGRVIDILHLGHHGMAFAEQRDPEHNRWTNPYNLTPWVVTAAIAGINEHQTLVVEGQRRWEDQKAFKRAAQTSGSGIRRPVPPPYYTVYMRDQQIQESARREFRRQRDIEWSHRWDVRGHEIARIQRGPMPIDPKLERRLTRRGYKVFTMDRPDADSYRVLMARGQAPPKRDEWVAVLVSWRKPFVKGPAAKPYIPSVHRPTRGMIARNGKPS